MLVGVHLVRPVSKPPGLAIAEPFDGYSYNVGVLPLPSAVLPKARQWCRALQRQIRATWWAAVETDSHLAPDGVHHEVEAVSVEAGLAVAAGQVLYEIFLGAYPRRGNNPSTSLFERHCHADPQGQAASGLKLIRNGEMHATTIVVPDVYRAVGVRFDDGTEGLRIFPQWAEYDELPSEVRDARHAPKKGKPPGSGALKTNQIHHDHYRSAVAGRPVVEALMDALVLYATCDPRIVRVKGSGDYQYFPLEPIAERDYERRHPEWPTRAQFEAELRRACEEEPPVGLKRVAVAHVTSADGKVITHSLGFTIHDAGPPTLFAETTDQVRRDLVEHGFPYWAEGEDGVASPLVVAVDGEVTVDPSVKETTLMRLPDTDLWGHLVRHSDSDAFVYRTQRRPPV